MTNNKIVVQNNNMILKKENICILIFMIISLYSLYDYQLFNKQVIWYFLGILSLLLTKLNFKKIYNISFYLYGINVLLLVLVLFFGKEVNGSKAWFNVGILSFQPSEFMKISLILFLVYLLENKKNNLKLFISTLIFTIIPSVLVFIEPDTGAVIIYFIIWLVAILFSKIKKKYLFMFIGILLITITTIIYIYLYNNDLFIRVFGTSLFYRIDRILFFKNSLQLENALALIGTSSLFGYGNKIPLNIIEGRTDFVFTTVIAKSGFVGGMTLIISYLYFLKKIIYKDKLFSYILAGVLLFQMGYNIFMNLGILPIMGITLPFISYGGSSLLVYFILYSFYLVDT